jgi:hypothetical protein
MAEVAPTGVIDNEGRLQWYLREHPTIKPRTFPYDKPRAVRLDLPMVVDNPTLQATFTNAHPIFLVETANLTRMREATDEWNKSKEVGCIDLDSGSGYWDVLSGTRNIEDDDAFGKSWGPVYEYDRLFKVSLNVGGKHCMISAHEKEEVKIVKDGGKTKRIPTGRMLARMGKDASHWADLTVRLDFASGAPHPTLTVTDEGTGAAGGLRAGSQIENPTFRKLLERVGGMK